jgi:hypothetical protein
MNLHCELISATERKSFLGNLFNIFSRTSNGKEFIYTKRKKRKKKGKKYFFFKTVYNLTGDLIPKFLL